MSGQFVFFIVGNNDCPLYQADLTAQSKGDDTAHLNEFIAHAALDMVDDVVWTTKDMYLKVVDSFNEFQVSAFVTASSTAPQSHDKFAINKHSNTQPPCCLKRCLFFAVFVFQGARFLMIHKARPDESLKHFFFEVYELFIKMIMNPFYPINSPITSPVFDSKVRNLARRYLNV
eukprot:c15212_g1_i1.p1 GENE.c15212_g1_i1~~c15212_g1_i1.p1  ORF type:complete len:174 (+),score=40.50 c15212_g1_i1:44-565(+)